MITPVLLNLFSETYKYLHIIFTIHQHWSTHVNLSLWNTRSYQQEAAADVCRGYCPNNSQRQRRSCEPWLDDLWWFSAGLLRLGHQALLNTLTLPYRQYEFTTNIPHFSLSNVDSVPLYCVHESHANQLTYKQIPIFLRSSAKNYW